MKQIYDNKDIGETIDKSFDTGIKEGYRRCKEQMIEEAVEGVIEEVSFNNGERHNTIRFSFDEESLHVENRIWMPRCGKDGDKVHIIIIKDDGKSD